MAASLVSMPTRRQLLKSGGLVGLIAAGAGCAMPPDFGDGTAMPPETDDAPGPDGTTAGEETTEADETTAEPGETTAGEETTGTATGGEVTEVAVGPEGNTLRFEPDSVEVSVGDTVRWTFESPGHNVTTKSGASEKISIPADAEPFASYEGDQHFAIRDVGDTYEHTFTVAGEYTYVCAPHEDQGMVASVTVSEQ